MSSPVSLAPSSARSQASDIERTACLNTSRPAIFTYVRAVVEHRLAERHGRAARRTTEQLGERAVAAHVRARGFPSRCLRALEHRRAGAVAEQHAGRAILPVDDGAQLLGADDQRGLGVARSPSALRRRSGRRASPSTRRETSNAAARVAPSAACRSTAVDGSRRSGVAVPSTMTSSSPACTPARSIAMRAAVAAIEQLVSLGRGDVALVDAGALDDPLVGRVEADRRELVRSCMTRRGTPRPVPATYAIGRFTRALSAGGSPRRRPMCSFMSRLDGARGDLHARS